MNLIEELSWRGMIQDIMPGTEEELNKGTVSGYIGFDPTADSLHVGHLTQIMTLIHFQRAGHKPFALVGGATGMVGDPSGKSAERNLLSEEVLNHNVACLENQLKKFLDFDCGANSAEMVNNYEWFKNFNFLDFIRDVGKHITVNYMMAKDSVKKRLEGETGMSFTEFTYQLVQGFDFYWLWKNKNCKVQMGGSDQWGNIVTGTELIRRKDYGSAFAITTQLIKKADGTKFGKTESGAIWLDREKTKPFDFHQFWTNISDIDVKNWIRIFSLKIREEIEDLEREHDNAPHRRILQNVLADEITERVHGAEAVRLIKLTKEFTFNNSFGWEDLLEISEIEFLEIFNSTSVFFISGPSFVKYLEQENILDFLVEIGNFDEQENFKKMFESKGEAKRLVENGGVYINKVKVRLDSKILDFKKFNDRYLFVQKGKKNSALVVFCEDIHYEMERMRLMRNSNF